MHTVPHEQWLRERLRVDGEFAREYLQAAIEERWLKGTAVCAS